jgi:septal ring factor EnvC (AmiA/AmiB activator)
MVAYHKIARYVLIGSFVVMCGMAGCTKKPSNEELAKLEEARSAAESAERKLAELREERMNLESQLSQKQAELREHEAERDDLQEKMKTHNQ